MLDYVVVMNCNAYNIRSYQEYIYIYTMWRIIDMHILRCSIILEIRVARKHQVKGIRHIRIGGGGLQPFLQSVEAHKKTTNGNEN